jgi:hypothetical protein
MLGAYQLRPDSTLSDVGKTEPPEQRRKHSRAGQRQQSRKGGRHTGYNRYDFFREQLLYIFYMVYYNLGFLGAYQGAQAVLDTAFFDHRSIQLGVGAA